MPNSNGHPAVSVTLPRAGRRKPPVTIQQVAQRIGVSMQTVSAILGSKAHLYREETQRLVRTAAEELGYRPNVLAKATRTGRSGNISLLVGNDLAVSPLNANLLQGIEREVSARSLRLFLTQLPDNKLTDEGFVPNVLREWFSDGLLINYHYRIPGRMIELIHSNDLPSIWINSRQVANCVYPDESGAAATLTQFFLKRGHRRIAYVDFLHGDDIDREHHSVTDRRDGYKLAMREAGLEPVLRTFSQKVALNRRVEIARELFDREKPTAVVTYNDTNANAIGVACLLTGRTIQGDLHIGTFAPKPIRVCSLFTAPTMVVPDLEMGIKAVDLLLRRIETPGKSLPPEVVPFELYDESAGQIP